MKFQKTSLFVRGALACAATLFVILMGGGALAASCDPDGEPIRIAVASFAMETCTFCPRPTDVEHFEHYGPPYEGDEVLEVGFGLPGFMLAANDYCNVEVIGSYVVRQPFGGSSGGWVTRRAFEKYSNEIAERLAAIEGLDGVFLPLHGAMAVTGVPRPEAELVKRVKKATGGVPVAVIMDLHGNEDAALPEAADIMLSVKRFPHYDFNLMGERAARLLIRTIKGAYAPTIAARKPGVLFATVFGGTGEGVAQDVMERARRWENQHLDAYVSVFWGFTFADVPDVGVAAFAMTNNDQALADKIADDMNAYIQGRRDEFEYFIPKTGEGVSTALKAVEDGRTPFVIADMSDRLGDGTHILKELMRRDARNFVVATIADADVIEDVSKNYKVGDAIDVSIGGGSSELAGGPARIVGNVSYIGEYRIEDLTPSPIVGLEFGRGNLVFLSPAYHQVTTRDFLDHVGVSVEDVDLVVVKSRRHYIRGFIETGLAKESVIIDAPGHGPADISTLTYKNLPDGVYSKYFNKE